MRREQAAILAAALLANPDAHAPRLDGHRSAAADPARLRGLPAIGRGVEGAIPGTRPGGDGHLT